MEQVSAQQQDETTQVKRCVDPLAELGPCHMPRKLGGHCSFQQTDLYSQLFFTSATSFKCSALGSSPMGDWKTLGPWGCQSSVQCQDNISRENI